MNDTKQFRDMCMEIYIYGHICICTHVYIYTYMCIRRQRESTQRKKTQEEESFDTKGAETFVYQYAKKGRNLNAYLKQYTLKTQNVST